MKIELQNKLFEKYPKIFAQKDLDKSQTCMCWGVECGDGWYWLIDNLCEHLQFHIDRNGKPQIEAVQVKEKFGGLCFCVQRANQEEQPRLEFLRGAICFTEKLSRSICESCGSTENVTTPQSKSGCIATRCQKCLKAF